MSSTYRKKVRRAAHGPPFIQLHHYLVDSVAWHELSHVARSAYIELWRVYNGINNGTLGMSVRRLAHMLPCSPTTAKRALDELEQRGFIVPVRIGTFSRKDGMATEYRMTSFRCDVSGQPPTKDFDPGKRWNGKSEKRPVTKLGLAVLVSVTEPPKKPSAVTDFDTVRPCSAKFTVPRTGTHIDSNHRGCAVAAPSSRRNRAVVTQ